MSHRTLTALNIGKASSLVCDMSLFKEVADESLPPILTDAMNAAKGLPYISQLDSLIFAAALQTPSALGGDCLIGGTKKPMWVT